MLVFNVPLKVVLAEPSLRTIEKSKVIGSSGRTEILEPRSQNAVCFLNGSSDA